MSRGNNKNPAIVIIVIILVLFIIPTCICGGLFVVGWGVTISNMEMEQIRRDETRLELKRIGEELHSATELVPDADSKVELEAEVKDNPGATVAVPEVE